MYKSIVKKHSVTNRLRKHCCFLYACQCANIPFNGNQIEARFSKHIDSQHRSGKFTKLLRDDSIPTPKTVASIGSEVKGFERLFNAPLWDALYCAENKTTHITELLSLQDLDVVNCLFNLKRNKTGNLSRKQLHTSDIKKILKIGSLSALSSLILLRAEFDKRFCCVSKPQLERHITSMFINLCALKVIPCIHWEIYENLKSWLFTSSKFTLNSQEKFEQSTHNTTQLLRFINLSFIRHKDKNQKLLSYAALGNKHLIFSELNKVNKGQALKYCKPEDEQGLRWLIGRMYSLIPKNDFLLKAQTFKYH